MGIAIAAVRPRPYRPTTIPGTSVASPGTTVPDTAGRRPPANWASADEIPRMLSADCGAGAGSPETVVVASTVVSDGRAPAQRFMPVTGGNAAAASRLCLSSDSKFQSACGDGGK